jgi:hypothetical protein
VKELLGTRSPTLIAMISILLQGLWGFMGWTFLGAQISAVDAP